MTITTRPNAPARRRLVRSEAVFTTASGATLIATAPPGHRPSVLRRRVPRPRPGARRSER